jgi:hypothetical protein
MIVFDTFLPFFGVVESTSDPEQLGRLQVRCYGYHTDSKAFIPTDYLRWFSAIVSNSAGTSGIGHSPTGYVQGSTVFGYFLSREMQDGIVLGSITGKPTQQSIQNLGFNDPAGIYPIYINESDVNRLARGNTSHWVFNLRANAQVKNIQKPLSKGAYEELDYQNKAVYPNNDVYETPSGHLKEFDNTDGEERIHEYHRTGTYYEIDKSGNRVVKIVGDGYEIIAGDKFANVRGTCNLTIEGDVNQYIKGDYNLQVDGNKTEVVLGNVREYYGGDQTTMSSGSVAVDGTTIDFNSGNASSNASIPVTLPAEYSIELATPVIRSAGRYAALDEQSEIGSTPTNFPADVVPPEFDGQAKTISDRETTEKETGNISCSTVIGSTINYNLKLGDTDFTIGDLSLNALFSHSIRSQGGLTQQDIVCNLEALAKNILQPLKDEYGSFNINSGFRVGSGRSQHHRGQGVDIQVSSWNSSKYMEVAEWIADNLPHDQLIFEHGNSIWLHISFDSSKDTQRGELLTMLNGKYEQGLNNYYA